MSACTPLFCLLFVVSVAQAQSRAPLWELVDLGGFEGTNSNAQAINDLGLVAGRADNTASLWSNGQHIALPHPIPSVVYSDAWDVNRSGLVAGCSYDLVTGRQEATLWTTTASAIVGSLPGGTESCAHAINDFNLYVGASATVGAAVLHAFVGHFGELVDLHPLVPWAGLESMAWDINDKGQVVGTVSDPSWNGHAVIWHPSGGVEDLGTLGGRQSTARGINEAGDVVGGAETAAGTTHTFLSVVAAGHRTLPLLDLGKPVGTLMSEGIGVNAGREVVGWAQYQNPNGPVFVATYWTANLGMIDLDEHVAHPDWHLEQANGINDDGDIVGYGVYYPVGDRRGFLLRRVNKPITAATASPDHPRRLLVPN